MKPGIHKNQYKARQIGILAGGIAHDFNNYLTAILGNISLARLNLETGDFFTATPKQDDKSIIRCLNAAENVAIQAVCFLQPKIGAWLNPHFLSAGN